MIQLETGTAFTCAITARKEMYCSEGASRWGPYPREEVEYVSIGADQACVLFVNTTAYCWGDARQSIPANLTHLSFHSISAGHSHVCGILFSQELKCWGASDPGIPEEAKTFAWRQVSLGFVLTCGITILDNLYCWGYNNHGQAMHPTNLLWKSISAGNYHVCGIDSDGNTHCWGALSHGLPRCYPWKQRSCGSVSAAFTHYPDLRAVAVENGAVFASARPPPFFGGSIFGTENVASELQCAVEGAACCTAGGGNEVHFADVVIVSASSTLSLPVMDFYRRPLSVQNVTMREIVCAGSTPAISLVEVDWTTLISFTLIDSHTHLNIVNTSNVLLSKSLFSNVTAPSAALTVTNAVLVGGTVLTFQHCHNTAGFGGAFSVSIDPNNTFNTFVLRDSVFEDNSAAFGGGALFIKDESRIATTGTAFKLTRTTWNRNTAIGGSGGALVWDSSLKASPASPDSPASPYTVITIELACSNNTARGTGGCLLLHQMHFVGAIATVIGNEGEQGGGIMLMRSSFWLSHCEFADNTATRSRGGGMFASQCLSSSLKLEDVSFSRNTLRHGSESLLAPGGGGLYVESCQLTVIRGTWRSNEGGSGGALYIGNIGSLSTTDVLFEHNIGWDAGGAVFAQDLLNLEMINNRFENNTAMRGGGCFMDKVLNAEMQGTEFVGNTADKVGGALVISSSTATLRSVNCSFNSVPWTRALQPQEEGEGGCVASANSAITFNGGAGSSNSAPQGGFLSVQCPNPNLVVAGSVALKDNVAYQGGSTVFLRGCQHPHDIIQSLPAVNGSADKRATTSTQLLLLHTIPSVYNGIVYRNQAVATFALLDAFGHAISSDNTTACSIAVSSHDSAPAAAVSLLSPASLQVKEGQLHLQPFGVLTEATAVVVNITCGLSSIHVSTGFGIVPHPPAQWETEGLSYTVPSSRDYIVPVQPPLQLLFDVADIAEENAAITCTIDSTRDSRISRLVGNTSSTAVLTRQQSLIEFSFLGIVIDALDTVVTLEAACSLDRGVTFRTAAVTVGILPLTAHWAVAPPNETYPRTPAYQRNFEPAPQLYFEMPLTTSLDARSVVCKLAMSSAALNLGGQLEGFSQASSSNVTTVVFPAIYITSRGDRWESARFGTIEPQCTWLGNAVIPVPPVQIHVPTIGIATLPAANTGSIIMETVPFAGLTEPLQVNFTNLETLVGSGPLPLECTLQAADPASNSIPLLGTTQFPIRTAFTTLPDDLMFDHTAVSFPFVIMRLLCYFASTYRLPQLEWRITVHGAALRWEEPPPAVILPTSKLQLIPFSARAAVVLEDGSGRQWSVGMAGECSFALGGAALAAMVGPRMAELEAGQVAANDLGISADLNTTLTFTISCSLLAGGAAPFHFRFD